METLENATQAMRPASSAPSNDPSQAERLYDQAIKLETQYRQTKDITKLKEAIKLLRQDVDLTPDNHPDRIQRLSNLGNSLYRLHEWTGTIQDLDEAISLARQAMDLTPGDNPDRLRRVIELGIRLKGRYDKSGARQDLEAAIQNASEVVDLSHGNVLAQTGWLNDLGYLLCDRYKRTGEMADIDKAIEAMQRAVDLTPDDHLHLSDRLNSLASLLDVRYEQTGVAEDLEDAIQLWEEVVELTPEIHPYRAERLESLAYALEIRNKGNSIPDYEEANREARDLTPTDSGRDASTDDLATLTGQDDSSRKIKDLEDVIRGAREAIESTSGDDYTRAKRLSDLAENIDKLYDKTAAVENLEDAIKVARQAIKLTPSNDTNRAQRLDFLEYLLDSLYDLTAEIHHLDEAILLSRQSLNLTVSDDARARRLNALGFELEFRYERTGQVRDLEEAISVARQAINLAPEGSPERAAYVDSLRPKLESQYRRTGTMQDLEEVIQVIQQVTSLTTDDPTRARSLNKLGNAHLDRYDRTGEFQDLKQALRAVQQATDLIPDDDANQMLWMNHLGFRIAHRPKAGGMEDPDEARRAVQQAVDLIPDDHPKREAWLNALQYQLDSQPTPMQIMQDVDQAVQNAQQLATLNPNHRLLGAERLSDLGVKLAYRYEQTGEMKDLEEAIRVTQQGINLLPNNHPRRAAILIQMGNFLDARMRAVTSLAQGKKDLDLAVDCYERASRDIRAKPIERVQAARNAIHLLRAAGEWHRAVLLAKGALELIPLVCGRFLAADDQQHAVAQISGFAADVCSVSLRIGDPKQALQQLEFGRGIILGYMIDSKTKADGPNLIEQYEVLRIKASRWADSQDPAVQNQLLKERMDAFRELDACLTRINQVYDYEQFLLENTVEDLKRIGDEGPVVVVNVTAISSDAIIIWDGEIIHLPLVELSPDSVPFHAKGDLRHDKSLNHRDIAPETSDPEIVEYLSWLWSNGVKVVFDRLKASGWPKTNEASRIWWVGSGIASTFPFHAANSGTNDTVSSIPSYTPTIKALAYSRSQPFESDEAHVKDASILIVTMPTTPGQDPLAGVDRESAVIEKVCKDICACQTLSRPTADEVLDKIPHSSIVHFACHGASDPRNPLNSHLLLQKGSKEQPCVDRLTVSNISKVAIQGTTKIAFLSACSTAQTNARGLADEGLHLASAFQVAGFSHVIGSLWPVDDDMCVLLAELFYRELISDGQTEFSNRAIASALWSAVAHIQLHCSGDPFKWAPFVHFGA